MGVFYFKNETIKDDFLASILEGLNNDIISTINKSNSNSLIKEVVNLLSTFLMSDDFIPFYFLTHNNFLFYIFSVLDKQDTLLFLRILFPLFEELKNKKFETKLWQVENLESEKNNILISYYNKNETLISKRNHNGKNIIESINSNKDLEIFFENIVNIMFKKDIYKSNNDFLSTINKYIFYIKLYIEDEKILKELLDYLMKLEDNLKYTKEIFYLIIFSLNGIINLNKIDKLTQNSEDKNKNFEKFLDTVDLKKNFIWIFYEQNYDKKYNKKYIEYAYVGTKIYEKLPINAFETINKKDRNKPIDAYISKSVFSNFEVLI